MTDKKHRDPWTDPDPQPGDFDEYLKELKPEDVEHYGPGEGPKWEVIVIDTDDVDGWLRERDDQRRREARETARRSA